MQIFLIVVLGVIGSFGVILIVYVGGNWLLRRFRKSKLRSEGSKWCRLAHSQFPVATSTVAHIKKTSRRFSPVISVRQIAIPRILSPGPNGIRISGAFECSFRRGIREAHVPRYKTMIAPELSATSQRKVPLDASTHPTRAQNRIAIAGV